jgi:hypothetical protein
MVWVLITGKILAIIYLQEALGVYYTLIHDFCSQRIMFIAISTLIFTLPWKCLRISNIVTGSEGISWPIEEDTSLYPFVILSHFQVHFMKSFGKKLFYIDAWVDWSTRVSLGLFCYGWLFLYRILAV